MFNTFCCTNANCLYIYIIFKLFNHVISNAFYPSCFTYILIKVFGFFNRYLLKLRGLGYREFTIKKNLSKWNLEFCMNNCVLNSPNLNCNWLKQTTKHIFSFYSVRAGFFGPIKCRLQYSPCTKKEDLSGLEAWPVLKFQLWMMPGCSNAVLTRTVIDAFSPQQFFINPQPLIVDTASLRRTVIYHRANFKSQTECFTQNYSTYTSTHWFNTLCFVLSQRLYCTVLYSICNK